MKRLNIFERKLNIISLGDKEVILRERNIYDLFTSLDYLAAKDLTGFITFTQDGLSNAGLILPNIDKYIEKFFLLHLPQESKPVEDSNSEDDNYIKFVRSATQLLLKFSEIWGIDPIEIAQKYTIRQLNEFAKIISGENKTVEKTSSSYKSYIDEFGRKVEEWEEVI